jgi:hypothetical protein
MRFGGEREGESEEWREPAVIVKMWKLTADD